MMNVLNRERRFIFLVLVAISLFGTLMVYEASSIYAFKNFSDPAYFFKRQFIFLLIGILFFFLILLPDIDFLRQYNKGIMVFSLLLLVVVLLVGRKVGGAKRWLYILGIAFQPSELLKLSFLLYASDYFVRKKEFIGDLKQGLLPLGVVVGVMCVLLLMEPDMGTAMFWIIWIFFFLFICQANKKHLFVIAAGGFIMAFFLIKFYPYRFRRITAYWDPFADPQGAGFQLIQSQIAYGEGGIFGTGFGLGKQKLFFLPAAHTDFIFSIIAEEFGLAGSLGLLAIFIILFRKMFNMARNISEPFRKNIMLGAVLIFFLEIMVNIGVSCGFFPTKGLPLPFLSYGGSNLIANYLLLGIFFNASHFKPVK